MYYFAHSYSLNLNVFHIFLWWKTVKILFKKNIPNIHLCSCFDWSPPIVNSVNWAYFRKAHTGLWSQILFSANVENKDTFSEKEVLGKKYKWWLQTLFKDEENGSPLSVLSNSGQLQWVEEYRLCQKVSEQLVLDLVSRCFSVPCQGSSWILKWCWFPLYHSIFFLAINRDGTLHSDNKCSMPPGRCELWKKAFFSSYFVFSAANSRRPNRKGLRNDKDKPLPPLLARVGGNIEVSIILHILKWRLLVFVQTKPDPLAL